MTSQPPAGPFDPDDAFDDAADSGDAADPLAGLGALFGPGGLGSMQDLLAQAQQMQTDLADTQRRLADMHVSGTSGGGLVRATVTGDRELVSLTIDPSVVDPADTEVLADLVVAAVRAANEHARVLGEQAMAQQVPDLPDLSALGFGGPGEQGGPGGADLPTGFGGLPPGLLGGAGGAGGPGGGAQDFGPSVPGGAAAASLPPVVPADDPAEGPADDPADDPAGGDVDGPGGRAPGV